MLNILDELEGLKGEQMAVAMLRILVMRSTPCRTAFLELLNQQSPVGPLVSASHFSCYTESYTTDESGSGRIDLVLELDNAVVGIEAKLFAAFQKDQPEKYRKDLERTAQGLSEVRGQSILPFIAILAPQRRSEEIKGHLGPRDAFITWTNVVDEFKRHSDEMDPSTLFLFQEFQQFLSSRVYFLPDLKKWLPHLLGRWDEGGNARQRKFLRRVSEVFPDSGVLNSGPSWVGYYFSPEVDGARGWFGFVPGSRAGETDQSSVLVIGTDRELAGTSFCPEITLDPRIYADRRHVPAWKVNLDESWNEANVWQERLQSFFST